ncbi:glycosyltransferase family 2 protein [Nocardia vulneris]|uniref:glycosyltransferase family 2 protein n=1 Tax=Nocardia vulneris TaxID=1141657 RepID=UPI00143552C2|nr:glycosyltransferase family 2 protein [Nocardia vulneris]
MVIPTYNRPEMLRSALSSVANQRGLAGEVEVIVVNDAGTEVSSTVEAVRDRGVRARLIDLPSNRGLPMARNIGIDSARGQFLALLDDDDVFLPDHLATMIAAIERENVDAAYGICPVSTTRVDPALPQRLEGWSHPFDGELLSVANFISVHAAVIRMPPAAARYDPGLSALEDWDMWLRLIREQGYRFHHVPEPTVIYHRLPEQHSMCGATMSDAAALSVFGRLAQRIWARWPASTARSQRFRLYIAVVYWEALTVVAEGGTLAGDFFQRCMGEIAATWHGDQSESDLPDRIIASIQERRVDLAR